MLAGFVPAALVLISQCVEKRVDCRKVGPNHERRLIDALFRDYNRNARPIEDTNRSIEVSISFYLTKILALDEKNQVLTTFGWLEVLWKDEYLTWDPEKYGGLRRIIVPPQMIWLPDFGLENSAETLYDDQADRKFRAGINHDGSVQWVPGGKFVTSCQLDITYYPFDRQMCELDFIDWTYDARFVMLVNGSDRIATSVFRTHGEWQVTRTKSFSLNKEFDSDPGVTFPTVSFQMFLQRKPRFYMINIVAPCILMSILDLLVFYLPPDSGEKVSIGITVLLSFSVFLLLIAENVPKTSDCIPLIGIYLTMVMAMTATSIVVSVLVLQLHHHDPSTPVPRPLRRIFLDFGRRLCILNSGQQHRKRKKKSLPVAQNLSFDDLDSTQLDQLDDEEEGHQSRRREESNGVKGQRNLLPVDVSSIALSSSTVSSILEEILANFRVLTDRLRDATLREEVKDDWKMVAKVFDRVMLIIFLVAITLLTFSILYIYPRVMQAEDNIS